MQSYDPSPARQSYDKIATNSNKSHPSEQVKSLFLFDNRIKSETETKLNEEQYQLCNQELFSLTAVVYDKNLTFRRLFNYTYNIHLCDGDKWHLSIHGCL